MNAYVLEREQVIPRSRVETFRFFSDAFNLERITPDFLRFRILTERPAAIRAGTILDYELTLFGVRVRWRTLIEVWEPDSRFEDVQVKGPYKYWRHIHSFETVDQSRTRMRDRVEYSMPFGVVGRIVHRILVRRMLARIFDYRARAIVDLLSPAGAQVPDYDKDTL
ncbi:MAG TPA: SRPBCC family protein [Blastocatellia bacterium]|nr:SRPBCC family protein [Blastocatellia bacterium]